jgi:hypothetical protein
MAPPPERGAGLFLWRGPRWGRPTAGTCPPAGRAHGTSSPRPPGPGPGSRVGPGLRGAPGSRGGRLRFPGMSIDAHTDAADAGHGFAPLDLTGVDGGADACHYPQLSSPTAAGSASSIFVHCPATSVFSAKALMPRRVVRVEAVLRLALGAGPAFAAHGAPVQEHPVAGSHLGNVRSDGADHIGGLMAQQVREPVAAAGLLVVKVRVADTARESTRATETGTFFSLAMTGFIL